MIFPRVLYECVSRAKEREVEVGFQHKSTNVMEEEKKNLYCRQRGGVHCQDEGPLVSPQAKMLH